MRALLLLSICLAASGAMAQGPPGPPPPPDSTSAWRYYPLHLGDAWQYDVFVEPGSGPSYSYTLFRQVRKDTLVDGQHYAVAREWARPELAGIPTPEARRYLARFDTLSARVATREIGAAAESLAPCSLSESFPRNPEEPREVTCADGTLAMVSGSYEETVTIGAEVYTLTAKTIGGSGAVDFGGTYAADVGLVGSYFGEAGSIATRLVTARIQGQFYGDAPEAEFPGIPDTTDAARYYPLGVGDAWQYQTCGSLVPCGSLILLKDVVREEFISDTTYAVVRYRGYERNASGGYELTRGDSEQLERFDPRTTRLMMRVNGREVASCPLGADFDLNPLGVEGDDCSLLRVSGEVSDPYGAVKTFESLGGSESYAVDVGLVGTSGDGSSVTTELVYWRVGGAEQGTPFPVASDATPEAQPLAISAVPNPTAGPLAVTLRARGAVVRLDAFDALGRRVLSRETAPGARVEIDASGWAPGLYILRATSGDEVATTRVVKR